MIRTSTLLGAFLLTATLPAFAQRDCGGPDTSAVARHFAELRQGLGSGLEELRSVTNPEERRRLALALAARPETWIEEVRCAWPEDDGLVAAFWTNTALALAFASTEPCLASYYTLQASTAQAIQDTPYRPAGYAMVLNIRDQAQCLAQARGGARVQRLQAKLERSYAELLALE